MYKEQPMYMKGSGMEQKYSNEIRNRPSRIKLIKIRKTFNKYYIL